MRPRLGLAAGAAALVLLTGCSGAGSPEGSPDGSAESSTDGSSGSTDPAPSTEPSGEVPTGGTSEAPAAVEPTAAPLDWRATGGSAEDRRVVGPTWTGLVDPRGTRVTLEGPRTVTVEAGPGRIVSELLMEERWAVVVAQDQAEQRPSVATVVDLTSGDLGELAGPVPASGGSWALADGTLHYPTYDGGAYCLAAADLAAGTGEVVWCAPPRHGFSRLVASQVGTTLMTFDDARPVSCRTLARLEEGEPVPLEGVEACTGWEAAVTPEGAVWSTVPEERRSEIGEFWARHGGAWFALGRGTTGTLTPCGDSVWFVRDPEGPREPARLLRWTPDTTLEVAYESRSRGNAFLAPPECAGGVLTVSAFGEQGDAQVTATAP